MSTKTEARRSQILYRMFDAEGALLYVGITMNLGPRMKQHRGTKSWFDDVASITTAHFPDRPSVEAAEREAIRTERPRHNVALVPIEVRPRPIRPRTGQTAVQTVRMDDSMWDQLGAATAAMGIRGRAAVIRQFVRWYMNVPGAGLPQRPARPALPQRPDRTED